MQSIKLYLKPHQEKYLQSICGKPANLGAKYNLAPLVFSLLRWEEFKTDQPGITAYVPDWVMEQSGGKCYLSQTGHKILGDYIDSLLDVDFWEFIKPYHIIETLSIKDGVNMFIEKHNLPDGIRVYDMLIKRYYRMRKSQKKQTNPAEFFGHLSTV